MEVAVDISEFEAYAELCKEGGSGRPLVDKQSVDVKLKLYGLGRQSAFGDNTAERPGIFSPIERKKWDAWSSVKGKSQNDAKVEFLQLAKKILGK